MLSQENTVMVFLFIYFLGQLQTRGEEFAQKGMQSLLLDTNHPKLERATVYFLQVSFLPI